MLHVVAATGYAQRMLYTFPVMFLYWYPAVDWQLNEWSEVQI